MKEKMTNDKIIGAFLDINADIVYEQFNSKLPKFLSDFKYNRMRKKLLKTLKKFKDSDVILNADNIIELITYIYNNSDNDHSSFRNVIHTSVKERLYDCVISLNDLDAVVNVDMDYYPKINVATRFKGKDANTSGIDVQVDKLYSTDDKKNRILKEINREMIDTIYEYTYNIISLYMGE